jgi:hypothetical protein
MEVIMTTQEASSRMFDIKQFVENSPYFGSEDVEAIDMAWEALEGLDYQE